MILPCSTACGASADSDFLPRNSFADLIRLADLADHYSDAVLGDLASHATYCDLDDDPVVDHDLRDFVLSYDLELQEVGR